MLPPNVSTITKIEIEYGRFMVAGNKKALRDIVSQIRAEAFGLETDLGRLV